jgi:Fic family protein
VLDGINRFAGNYRPSGIDIIGSKHRPPLASTVPGLVEDLCDCVNENFHNATALRLAAYVMWRLNWIHPFDDGNGRTAASYLILCVKLGERLPGKRTIPDLISGNKAPYYHALEAADAAWTDGNRVDLSELEQLLENLLGAQLVNVIEVARGRPIAYA